MGIIRFYIIIIHSDHIGKPKTIQPGNREWVIAIDNIVGNNYIIPPFLMVKGRFHLAN